MDPGRTLTPRHMRRKFFDPWLLLSITVFAASGLLGTWSGLHDWSSASTRLQVVSSLTQLAYGILALMTLPALLIGWRGLRILLFFWVATISVSSGIAPVAWGGATPGEGVAVMVLSAAAGGIVLWIVRRAQVVP